MMFMILTAAYLIYGVLLSFAVERVMSRSGKRPSGVLLFLVVFFWLPVWMIVLPVIMYMNEKVKL